jgi:hypothetical protein
LQSNRDMAAAAGFAKVGDSIDVEWSPASTLLFKLGKRCQ